MKWYMALNEGGTRGDIALHTKLAVLSGLARTDLEPHLLYIGEHNAFTDWLSKKGVQVIDSKLPYLPLIERLTAEGRYHTASVGHWLRTNVCLEEASDEFILYTDVDVFFQSQSDIVNLKPRYFSATPEFQKDGWNYFNAGVMVANMPGLRSEYEAFEAYVAAQIEERTYNFHDQIAYNDFYRGRWDRLPIELNWKPYWGIAPEAPIVHFHGPKLGAIRAILEQHWHWSSNHGTQIGSLLASNLAGYEYYVGKISEICGDLDDGERAYIDAVQQLLPRAAQILERYETDTSFMSYRMYPD
jgi:hypothetical protein